MKKLYLFLVMTVLFVAGALGQNPTLIYTTNGIAIYPAGRHVGVVTVGISTVGAVNGNVLEFNGTTWVPASISAAGGADIFSVSNNIFTAKNTFRGNIEATNGVNGSVSNLFSELYLFQRNSDGRYITFSTTNGTAGYLAGNGLGTTIQLITAGGAADISLNNTTATASLMANAYAFDPNGANFNANLTVTKAFNNNDSAIIGSNLTVGTHLYSTNLFTTNFLGTTFFYPRGPNGQHVIFGDNLGNEIGTVRTNAHGGFTLSTTNNTGMLSFRPISSTLLVSNFTFEAAGNTILDGNVTLGDSAADTITANANTMTIVGQLAINNFLNITNSSLLIGASTPPASLTSKVYVNGGVRADHYAYNVLSTNFSATGTNSIDFSTNMVVNITGVTAGLTLTSANLLAGRSASIIFQGASSNILLTVPTGWIPLSQTSATVITNKMVAIHALALGTADSNVVYTITQQP